MSGADDKTVRVWDLASGNLTASFTSDGPFLAVAFAPNHRRILAGDALGRLHFLELLPAAVDRDPSEP